MDEPVTELQGPVEVVVRRVGEGRLARIPQHPNVTAWEAAFDAWVEGHDRTVPIPSPESLRRESIYEDRT